MGALVPLRLCLAALIGLGSLGLTGCGEAPLPAEPAQTAAPPAQNDYPSQKPTPVSLLDEDQTKGLESTPWQLVRADGRALTIRYVAGGGCSKFRGVRVVEHAKGVEIWTAVQTDRGVGACAAYLALGATTVHLSTPLDGRALLHAPVSQDWKTYIDNF